MEVHVPHDVVLNHILPRVPAKSVSRFKCVSKEWRSFLSSDMFRNKHNRRVNDHKNNLKLLVMSKTETSSFEFTTIDCEEPPSDKGLTPTRRPLPSFGYSTTPHYIHILASFHGLVCLGIIMEPFDDYSDLILWNPLTNEYKRLSKSDIYEEHNYRNLFFELYYSRCEDDYKLLFFRSFGDNVYIYSLRSDSWRKVDAWQHTRSRIYPGSRSRGTYLNGNLYFVHQDLDGQLSSIIRFDTITERFSEIEPPDVDYNLDADNCFASIVVISDCIHVCVKYNTWLSDDDHSFDDGPIIIKLWKSDDEFENMEEVLTYQLRPHPYDHTVNHVIPFHLMKNGNWIMLPNWSSYDHRIYKVDLKKKMHITDKGKEKETETGNIYDSEYVIMDSNIVDKEVGYIETFVSPNRYSMK